MNTIKTLLVDDEYKARELLKNLLSDYCPQVEIVGEAEDVKSAVKFLLKNSVDLVFLDIDMPGENGFALFDYFETPTFETVFCTAHTDYALKAFEVSAIDYIVKPISIQKLISTIEKCAKITQFSQISQRIDVLKENYSQKTLQKIAIPSSDGYLFVKLDAIYFFEADGSYTQIVTEMGKIIVSKKLKDFDLLLTEDKRFFRVHRSFLVNIEQVKKYTKKDGAFLTFGENIEVPLAREKKNDFDEFIDGIIV